MNRYLEKKLGVNQPKNLEEITPKLIQKIVENLNVIERLKLKINGSLFIENIKLKGWTKELPFYLFKCDLHGYELNYPQGHYMRLICLDCLRKQLEETQRILKKTRVKKVNWIKEDKPDNTEISTITA